MPSLNFKTKRRLLTFDTFDCCCFFNAASVKEHFFIKWPKIKPKKNQCFQNKHKSKMATDFLSVHLREIQFFSSSMSMRFFYQTTEGHRGSWHVSMACLPSSSEGFTPVITSHNPDILWCLHSFGNHTLQTADQFSLRLNDKLLRRIYQHSDRQLNYSSWFWIFMPAYLVTLSCGIVHVAAVGCIYVGSVINTKWKSVTPCNKKMCTASILLTALCKSKLA